LKRAYPKTEEYLPESSGNAVPPVAVQNCWSVYAQASSTRNTGGYLQRVPAPLGHSLCGKRGDEIPEHEIRPSDMHCSGCGLYLGLGVCVLPPGCCVLADPDGFEAVPSSWDSIEQIIGMEGETP